MHKSIFISTAMDFLNKDNTDKKNGKKVWLLTIVDGNEHTTHKSAYPDKETAQRRMLEDIFEVACDRGQSFPVQVSEDISHIEGNNCSWTVEEIYMGESLY